MPEVTDKDVEKSKAKVQKLRQQVLEAEQQLVAEEANRTNATKKAVLDNEAVRLEQQLAAAKERLKISKKADAAVTGPEATTEVDTSIDENLEPTPTPTPGTKNKEQ